MVRPVRAAVWSDLSVSMDWRCNLLAGFIEDYVLVLLLRLSFVPFALAQATYVVLHRFPSSLVDIDILFI